jgi:hypothetical protein
MTDVIVHGTDAIFAKVKQEFGAKDKTNAAENVTLNTSATQLAKVTKKQVAA